MSYTKTVWASGDPISFVKLNKIEQGIYSASNGKTVYIEIQIQMGNQSIITFINNLTGQQVLDIINSGKSVAAKINFINGRSIFQICYFESCYYDDTQEKYVFVFDGDNDIYFKVSSLSENFSLSSDEK